MLVGKSVTTAAAATTRTPTRRAEKKTMSVSDAPGSVVSEPAAAATATTASAARPQRTYGRKVGSRVASATATATATRGGTTKGLPYLQMDAVEVRKIKGGRAAELDASGMFYPDVADELDDQKEVSICVCHAEVSD